MGLTRVTRTRAEAERIARGIRKDFKSRGIKKRRIVVKPVGRATLKKLMTNVAFRKLKKKREFGVFAFDKR